MGRIRLDRGGSTTVLVCDCGWRQVIKADRNVEHAACQAHQRAAHQEDKTMRDTIARRASRG